MGVVWDVDFTEVVSIVTCDGRVIVVSRLRARTPLAPCLRSADSANPHTPTQGKLRGYDQVTNVVVQECHERVFSVDEGVKQEPMGLQVIRGNNMYIHTTSQQTN